MDYKAIKTGDIENQELFEGEDVEVNNMPLWKLVFIFITFVSGIAYGTVNIVDVIENEPSGIIDGIKISLTIILTFMGLTFGGYKFSMRNNVKESLQTIEKNATKRDANAQIRHNQLIGILKAQTLHNVDQTEHNVKQTEHNDKMLVLMTSMQTSLDSIDKSLRRQ